MERGAYTGQLKKSAISDSLIDKTLVFIWSCLLPWRDDPERPFAEGEEDLNAQFHNFLDSRSRDEFPMVFFQHEQRQTGSRRVDLSAKPVQAVCIQGVTYSKYQPFLVIEGKRLPAPSKAREREYVTGEDQASGGIQRFKLGLHGKDHQVAVLLGYLQKGTPKHWLPILNGWILDLSKSDPDLWSESDTLSACAGTMDAHCGKAVSDHPRSSGCVSPEIKLYHFWVQMVPNDST